METVQIEGEREVSRNVKHYNLDLVLSIGYRVNSKQATLFRQWATKTLRQHITDGYTINKSRVAKNYQQFLEAVDSVKKLLPKGALIDTAGVLDLVSVFADTWLLLEAYDKNNLITKGATKKSVELTAAKITKSLSQLKITLVKKGNTTELFGIERNKDSVAGIVGNVMQSFSGKDVCIPV